MSGETTISLDQRLVEEVANQIGNDLSLIIGRDLVVDSAESERVPARVAGQEQIHISHRLDITIAGVRQQGCLLMPLPDAIGVACYLMVMSDEAVRAQRSNTNLNRSTKEAILEVANFVSGATDAVLRKWQSGVEMSARSAGCQGVAPGAIPNLELEAGSELVLGRLRATLAEFPAFEMLLMLPAAILAGSEG